MKDLYFTVVIICLWSMLTIIFYEVTRAAIMAYVLGNFGILCSALFYLKNNKKDE